LSEDCKSELDNRCYLVILQDERGNEATDSITQGWATILIYKQNIIVQNSLMVFFF